MKTRSLSLVYKMEMRFKCWFNSSHTLQSFAAWNVGTLRHGIKVTLSWKSIMKHFVCEGDIWIEELRRLKQIFESELPWFTGCTY